MSSTSLPKADIGAPAEHKPAVPKRKARRWVIGLIAGVLLVAIGVSITYYFINNQLTPLSLPTIPANLSASQIGLDQWQDYQQPLPAHPLDNPALPATPQVTPALALLEDSAGQTLIQQGDLTRGLAYLKAVAQAMPESLRFGNDYRLALRDHRLYQDEFTFFSALAKDNQNANIQIEYALTYVDQMRSCPKPPDGLVCQAQNSYSSINILNGILQKNPYNIIARYARGLNNLYWPTLMRHLPQSQEDLQYTVALTRVQEQFGPTFAAQAYVALGDVFGKAGQAEQARNVWLNGLKVVPSQWQGPLQQRLAIPQDQVNAQEDQQLRGLGVYVDTDVTVFWKKG